MRNSRVHNLHIYKYPYSTMCYLNFASTTANGHTTLKIPVLVRSLKSSNVGHAQYLDGWPLGNRVCRWHFCWYMSIFSIFVELLLTFVNLSSSFCRFSSGFVDFHLIFIDSWILLVYLFDLCRLLSTFLDFSCVWLMFVGFLSTSADFVHLFFDCSYFWLVFVDFQGSSDCNLFLL